jgi:glycosyltransferase involved in cell wall biosynthesis
MQPSGTILFRREFHGLTGGHLKVWDYFLHARESPRFEPRVYLVPGSILDHTNPWHGVAPPPLAAWEPAAAAVLFVAGLDWNAVPDPAPAPVVNLVQGVRHADPDDPRHAFLSRPAVRICVSEAVADAIRSTGRVAGPIHVIPNGIDPATFPAPAAHRDIPLLIAGGKNPSFALALADRLSAVGIRPMCLTASIERRAFLELLGRAETVVTLPLESEGFFLPALEAMAMGAVVVCPDCVGNRGFCRDAETCLRPAYTLDAVAAAAIEALALSGRAAAALHREASAEVRRHDLARERMAFLRILDSL